MARLPRTAALAAIAALLLALALATTASAATYTVDTTEDTSDAGTSAPACADSAGKCSLRAAVEQANANAGADSVTLPNGRYVLDAVIEVEDVVTINGASVRETIVDSNGSGQSFFVAEGGLTASNLTITGGPLCQECTAGGAIYADVETRLDLTDVRLTRSSAGFGGAIATFATTSLTRVRVDHNVGFITGGGVWAPVGDLRVVDSSFEGNTTELDGGAIAVNYMAQCGCGDSFDEDPRTADVDVSGTTFSDNRSGARGGAISTGGIDDGPVVLGPGAGLAAAEEDGDPLVRITNSTISGNTAGASLLGLLTQFGVGGGGIYNGVGDMALINDTVAENVVVGGFGNGFDSGGNIAAADRVSLRNTIVADGTAGGVRNDCASDHEGSRFQSEGNNLGTSEDDEEESLEDCGFEQAGDKRVEDAKLGPLADNGGLTPTHSLLDGSPALDAGTNAAGPALDQRGGDRPPEGGSAGDTRDIGAYEAYSLADLSVEVKAAAPNPATVGQPLTYTVVVRNNGPDRVHGVTLSDTLPSGLELVSADSLALGMLERGAVRTVTIVVRPIAPGSVQNTASIAAPGIADPVAGNNSASVTTAITSAPIASQQRDEDVNVNLNAPNTASLGQFMNGIVVESDCQDEECLRRFREHAAINTGATRIAGFNLTVSRASLAANTKRTRIRLRPCQSGSKNGRRHKRCMKGLRKAVKKAGKFRVKVVVSAVDAAGNKDYAKAFVTVGG